MRGMAASSRSDPRAPQQPHRHGPHPARVLPSASTHVAATGARRVAAADAPAPPPSAASAARALQWRRPPKKQQQQQQPDTTTPPPPSTPPAPLVHWRAGAWRLTHHDPLALAAASRALAARLRLGVAAEREAEREALARQYAGSSVERLERDGAVLARLAPPLPAGALYGQQKWAVSRARAAAGGPTPLLPPHHRFRPGDPVLLWPMGSRSEAPASSSSSSAFDATVLEVARDRVVLALDNAAGDALAVALSSSSPPSKRSWRLDRSPSDAAAQRQLDAIVRLEEQPTLDASDASDAFETLLRACLVGAPEAVVAPSSFPSSLSSSSSSALLLERVASTPPPWVRDAGWRARAVAVLRDLPGLNESQRAAVATSLTRTLTLWQGPPGTGKTRTCLALIEVLVRASEGGGEATTTATTMPTTTTASAAAAAATASAAASAAAAIPVLAVADTNAAADNLVEGLASRGLRVVRVGGAARVRPSLRHLSLEAQAEATPLGERAVEGRARSRALFAQARYLRQQQQAQAERTSSDLLPSPLPLEAEARREWGKAERLARAAARSVLEHAQVVAATCNASGDASLLATLAGGNSGGKKGQRQQGGSGSSLRPLLFRAVVIDEATQATEPATLVPLVRGAQMAVLAGDPRQLPPTVVSRRSLEPPALLGRTLFDRLSSSPLSSPSSPSPSLPPSPPPLSAAPWEEEEEEEQGAPLPSLLQPRLLDRQYRMHPRLALFPSRRFYGGLLKDGVKASSRPAPRGVRWPSSRTPAAVVCVEGGEGERRDDDDDDSDDDDDDDDDDGEGESSGGGRKRRSSSGQGGGGGSYRNAAEAQQSLRALRALLSAGDVRSVAILSPYRGQVRLIERLLRSPGPARWLERQQRRLERQMMQEQEQEQDGAAEEEEEEEEEEDDESARARRNGLDAPFSAQPLVTVSSVDGFQGREADAVILSVVRNNARGSIGFVSDPRRLCVAASRARRGLVVVCSEATLRASGSADWGAFLDWAEEEGVVVRRGGGKRRRRSSGGVGGLAAIEEPWPLDEDPQWS